MKLTLFSSYISGFIPGVRKMAGIFLCLLLGPTAFSQTYINNAPNYYNEPGPPSYPEIDATAFANKSVFSVSYNIYINNQITFCEPWEGTLYYTNNGEMMVNAPFTITGNLDFETTGVGYEFDRQAGNSNSMAGTFYNPGTIHCDSILDGNNVLTFDGFDFFIPTSIGGCIISATNIIDPGNIVVGMGGLLNMNGQNVDLSRSVLTMETGENQTNLAGNAAFAGTGIFGLNTNYWDPSVYLTPTTAESAFFPMTPFYLNLTNSVPYFDLAPNSSTSNNLYHAAFVQDTSSSNVSYSVYFHSAGLGLGSGEITIGWAGVYVDPATGQLLTNYLYLNDDVTEAGSTNVSLANGYPDNFTLTESATPLLSLPAAPAGFQTVFLSGSVTNRYAYGSFTSLTASETNASGMNPSGALTNLANRIQITATHELNLAYAQISGQIYTRLNSTNQFDGSPGALIASPYSDIALGVTNGSLTISNLLESQFADWNGTIQAWTTRWLEVDPLTGFTNDYRVLLVSSQLNPITTPQIQNLSLYSTNLVVNDVLNVFGQLYATPHSMTLAQNILGTGATSAEGELNIANSNNPSWSWSSSFPNLMCLTNNGAIRSQNLNEFISSAQSMLITTSVPPVAAMATLSEMGGTNVATNGMVSIGGQTYAFTNKISRQSPPYAVLIGPNFDASMTNLIAAINFSSNGAGLVYSTNNSYPNGSVTAGALANHAFTVRAILGGGAGNSVPVSTTDTNDLAWSGDFLSGGTDGVTGSTNLSTVSAPYSAIINNGILFDQGSTLWVSNFMNGGIISNGVGSFILAAQTATLTNGVVAAGGDVSLAANTLELSNLVLQAGRSLTLQATNWITDDGVSNANNWSVGSTNGTGFDGQGLLLPILPTNTAPNLNNLLGTTITMQSPPPNKEVASTWAGLDYGASTLGYNTNNMAIGQLVLDSLAPNSQFYFSGTGVSNAIYVDRLVLQDYASYANGEGSGAIPTLEFGNNLVIYYADAVASSDVTGGPLLDVSYQLNNSNDGRLRWVPGYTGHFSSTNLVYANGTTNTLNIGLVTSPYLDSNGNGIVNANDPQPVFVPSEVNFSFAVTNSQPAMLRLTWNSVPGATNYIYYTSNLASGQWTLLTTVTNSPSGISPLTNSLLEPINLQTNGFYRVQINPSSSSLYGP